MFTMPGAAFAGTSRARNKPIVANGIAPQIVMPISFTTSIALICTPASVTPEGHQQGHDDHAEGNCTEQLRQQIRHRRHRAGLLHLQPSVCALVGQTHADAEQRCADQAEAAVAGQQVLGEVEIAGP